MAETVRRLPLQRLAVFEAAARHGSFSAAARELGMTQSAVSHHIADLEDELGITLFARIWRGVAPTEAGAHLADGLGRSLGRIAAAVERAQAIGRGQALTVATDFGFAAFFLLPRLAALRAVMNGIDVRFVTRQEDFDPEVETEDVAIVFGEGPWPRCRETMLVGEEVTPVAAPGFLAERPPATPDDLARLPLLHLDAANRGRWLTWDDYLERLGTVRPPGAQRLSFNNYILVIQAAIAGQGVALGWRPLVDDALAQGLLVPVPMPAVTTASGYHLVEPARRLDAPGVAAFRRWLLEALPVSR